jgi:carbamoyl-phosphate synthase large subunit
MPKRSDIQSILVIGAGPIVIGQACEFDYAGTQACLALREEGYRVILVNSNPATIMTDPEYSDKTYIEPLTVESIERIIAKERPCALLPTMGGQTALNLTVALEARGVLARYNVQLIGASTETIQRAEDRQRFQKIMDEIGLETPKSYTARNFKNARLLSKKIGFPLIVRPSFTLGGSGCGLAYNQEEFENLCKKAFEASPNQTVTIDEALIGWKEFEMEVVRDKNNNCIIVCSIENFDPLGVHTGDSITIAPALTLTDKEYQKMRSASFAVLNAIGVETGGSNVQFAVNPKDGRLVVIEMNPRVSRSSALASKATGFPIAKVAAKLAVGYTLDELSCDITGNQIPASFEPVLDYIVVKIPKHQFEKFPAIKDQLGPQMYSVGEAMAIGRTFSEALLKAMRSMENSLPCVFTKESLTIPSSERIHHIFSAFQIGMSVDEVHRLTFIDPWFLEEIQLIVSAEKEAKLNQESVLELKRNGFSDKKLADIFNMKELDFRNLRKKWGIKPVFKRIDSCAAEFSTATSYAYACYEPTCEIKYSLLPKVIILGSGVNRIGQGIEFDYSCVHAVKAFKKLGFETIMINCNPETVSTDYSCADRLYFGPLTVEDVMAIVEKENPVGVCCQFGGQTPLNLARDLEIEGAKLIGLDTSIVELCEDRSKFREILNILNLKQPQNIGALNGFDSLQNLQYPVIVRPSFVIGGRGMEILSSEIEVQNYIKEYFYKGGETDSLLIESYLKDAIEIDIDAISDGHTVFVPYIMEQVESAGVHSGDSASYLPSLRVSQQVQKRLIEQTEKIARYLGIKGLLNIQFAIQYDDIYVLEVNPRASRSLPFLSKSSGIDLIELAVHCMMGESLAKLAYPKTLKSSFSFVKEAVFSSSKLPIGSLGPEMKSTGEVMGIGKTFTEAYQKAQIAAGHSPSKDGLEVYSLQEVYNV